MLADQLGIRRLGSFLAAADELTLVPALLLHASSRCRRRAFRRRRDPVRGAAPVPVGSMWARDDQTEGRGTGRAVPRSLPQAPPQVDRRGRGAVTGARATGEGGTMRGDGRRRSRSNGPRRRGPTRAVGGREIASEPLGAGSVAWTTSVSAKHSEACDTGDA